MTTAVQTQVIEPVDALEIAPTQVSTAIAAREEIRGAIIVAKQFPRDEDSAYQRLIKTCSRLSFAEGAEYSYPRGGTQVKGPSVKLAREAARLWGNMRYGIEIVQDDPKKRHIRAWAWDIESNAKASAEDSFEKLVQRKDKRTGVTTWVECDERDLRELMNKRGSLAVRNCILQLIPPDFIHDAREKSRQTVEAKINADPDAARKAIVTAFTPLGVTPEMLGEYLGHPLAQSTPTEIAELRSIFASLRDGNSRWTDYVAPAQESQSSLKDRLRGAKPPTEPTDKPEEKPVIDTTAEPVEMPTGDTLFQ